MDDIFHSRWREVRGRRPPSLKVTKESHKIRKPPVIIYTVSPKKIHATPNEFMSVVQRLTGTNTSPAPIPPPTAPSFQQNGFSISTSTSTNDTSPSTNSRTSSGSSLCGMEGRINWKVDPHILALIDAMGGYRHDQSSVIQPAAAPALNPNIDHLFDPLVPNHTLHFDDPCNPLLHNHNIMNTFIDCTNINKDDYDNNTPVMMTPMAMATTANPSTNNLVVNMPCPNSSDIFSTLFDL